MNTLFVTTDTAYADWCTYPASLDNFLAGRKQMRILVTVVSAITLVALSSSVFAQGTQKKYKRSCAEYCAEYCATSSGYRNYCFAECPARCEQRRSQQGRWLNQALRGCLIFRVRDARLPTGRKNL